MRFLLLLYYYIFGTLIVVLSVALNVGQTFLKKTMHCIEKRLEPYHSLLRSQFSEVLG